MNFYFEKIPLIQNKTFIIREFKVPQINFPKHIHPEFEINYVIVGSGKRIVGDHIGEFTDGELVMTGNSLPHQWINSQEFVKSNQLSHSIVLQIRSDFLGSEFFLRSEAQEISELFQRSCRGIYFGKKTSKEAHGYLIKLLKSGKTDSLILLLQFLNLLAQSQDSFILSSETFKTSKGNISDISEEIFEFLKLHYLTDISIPELAQKFKMSVTAFSHYFKKKTGKTFTALIIEMRLGYACNLLANTNLSISEIAFQSGFNNLSYFNRVFLKLKNITPNEFRRMYLSA